MKKSARARESTPAHNHAVPAAVRVAIYTRQSIAKEAEFGSIDAQREAIHSYILSRRLDGWVAIPKSYDDGGYSGGNTDRPAFARLMDDVVAGHVDVIAVYKFDRFSRSLPDLISTMKVLEQHNVSFVAITQAFDTRTSMGKLTLNVLASFAQFEREVISDRIRDKIHASRRRGQWTGGQPPLGYDLVKSKLVVNPEEAAQVVAAFEIYRDCGSLTETIHELDRRGIRTKRCARKDGTGVRGGKPMTKSTLDRLLRNELYLGLMPCGDDETVPGLHERIVDDGLFGAAQVQRKTQKRRNGAMSRNKWGALLRGILFCGRCGRAMLHHTTAKAPRVYRSYVCETAHKRGAAHCRGSRAPAEEMEEVVVTKIRAVAKDPEIVAETIAQSKALAEASIPEFEAQANRFGAEVQRLTQQRQNLLDALADGNARGGPVWDRIEEIERDIASATTRRDETLVELAQAQRAVIDEDDVRAALADFDPLWSQLVTKERVRLLQLLIDRVEFDSETQKLTIRFRTHGIHILSKTTEQLTQ